MKSRCPRRDTNDLLALREKRQIGARLRRTISEDIVAMAIVSENEPPLAQLGTMVSYSRRSYSAE